MSTTYNSAATGCRQQNAISLLQTRTLPLSGDSRGRNIQFTKTVSAVAIPMHIDDGRGVAHFRDALQQNLGDIHFARSFEKSVYLRITSA